MQAENTIKEKISSVKDGLEGDLRLIRELVLGTQTDGSGRRLAGNAEFLPDGRVLCRERPRGDSRYPYGRDGFNFWVSANGLMHANRGRYFLFLPQACEGNTPPIGLFTGVRTDESSQFTSHSLLPTPLLSDGEMRLEDRYTIFGHDAAYFISKSPELFSAARVFSAQSRGKEVDLCFSLYLENRSLDPLCTYSSAFLNPFCRNQFAPSSEDRWFKQVYVYEPGTADKYDFNRRTPPAIPSFVVRTNEDIGRLKSISNLSLVRRAICVRQCGSNQDLPVWTENGSSSLSASPGDDIDIRLELHEQLCTSWLGYVGSPRRDLGNATFLKTGSLERDVHMTTFNDNAVVGDLMRFVIPPHSYVRVDYVFSTLANDEEFHQERSRSLTAQNVDLALQAERECSESLGNLKLETSDGLEGFDATTFNHFLPYLKRQVAVCATLKGFMQPTANSLIGFRDVLQAIEGHLYDRPQEARAKLLEALSHMLVEGRCPRQYSLTEEGIPAPADLREFVDQGAWAISAVYTYLSVTGDSEFLDEVIGYSEADSAGTALVKGARRGTVLEHLLDAYQYIAQQRAPETGLVRTLYGDWNDAIDGLGVSLDSSSEFGTGVSVMASLQLYQNCSELIDILCGLRSNLFLEQLEQIRRLRESLRADLLRNAVEVRGGERRILHGWGDRRSFTVGGFQDADGQSRDGLVSSAFWVLSGMIDEDPSLRRDILQAFQRLDSKYGLRTFAPGFGPDADAIGRINRLPLGTAENGASYVHATTFGIAALFRLGEPRTAWDQIRRILPYSSHVKDPSHSPFVLPNSYVENPELKLDGQSMNDWQTGSSNMLLKLLIRYVVGLEVSLSDMRIAPADWSPFQEIKFQCVLRGRSVSITICRGNVAEREIRHNGRLLSPLQFDKTIGSTYAKVHFESVSQLASSDFVVTDPR